MEVRATLKFAREINKRINGNYCIQSVTLQKVPRNMAYNLIGGGYTDQDIDFLADTVKCLLVEYKPECYAMPRYISTGDLLKLFNRIYNKTLDDFMEAFLNEYQI